MVAAANILAKSMMIRMWDTLELCLAADTRDLLQAVGEVVGGLGQVEFRAAAKQAAVRGA